MKTREEPKGIDEKLCTTKRRLNNGETPELEWEMTIGDEVKKYNPITICRACDGYNPQCKYYKRRENDENKNN